VKAILLMALNDLRLSVRDKASFIWMLLLPLAMMWFFGNMTGGGGSSHPTISLSVVNHDDGWLSRALIKELETEQVRLNRLTPDEAESAEDKVRTLVIPAGLTRKALQGEQQTLRLEREPGSNESFGFAAQVHILRAIVRTLTAAVETQGEAPASDDEALARYRQLAERPDLVRLEVSYAGQGRPVPGGAAQSVPGIMTMTVLMMTLIYGGVFLAIEKESGMLRRQAGLPLERWQIFAGKLAGRLLIAGIQIVILVLAGRFLFGISWGSSPLGLLLTLVAFAIAVACMSTFLGAVVRTPAQASSVGWIAAMILAALGGCWWPAEVMPEWMRTAAMALPTAWAMEAFHALISFGRGIDGVIVPSVVLLGFAGLFAALGTLFLRFE